MMIYFLNERKICSKIKVDKIMRRGIGWQAAFIVFADSVMKKKKKSEFCPNTYTV